MTAAKRGEAELHILDFKTTWSEFQNPCQTAATRGEAELRIYILKETSPPQSGSQAVVCVSTPRKYPRSGYLLVTYSLKSWQSRPINLFNIVPLVVEFLHNSGF